MNKTENIEFHENYKRIVNHITSIITNLECVKTQRNEYFTSANQYSTGYTKAIDDVLRRIEMSVELCDERIEELKS